MPVPGKPTPEPPKSRRDGGGVGPTAVHFFEMSTKTTFLSREKCPLTHGSWAIPGVPHSSKGIVFNTQTVMMGTREVKTRKSRENFQKIPSPSLRSLLLFKKMRQILQI